MDFGDFPGCGPGCGPGCVPGCVPGWHAVPSYFARHSLKTDLAYGLFVLGCVCIGYWLLQYKDIILIWFFAFHYFAGNE